MNHGFINDLFLDCGTLAVPSFCDARGTFVKPYHACIFPPNRASFVVKESFVSQSSRGVLRGFHFQSPPHEQWKLVCCIAGEVLDVVLDLRQGLPTYGQAKSIVLQGAEPGRPVRAILIPPGVAHAFFTLSDSAILAYYVSREHSPAHDHGILWSSVQFTWPTDTPLISARDASLASLETFVSPFVYSGIE